MFRNKRITDPDHPKTRVDDRDKRDEIGLQGIGVSHEAGVDRSRSRAAETRRFLMIVSTWVRCPESIAVQSASTGSAPRNTGYFRG
jgi:hypothetical protein